MTTTSTSRLTSCLGLALGLGNAAFAGGTQFTQINSGAFMWTDRAGNTHLFGGDSTTRGVQIEFWEDDTNTAEAGEDDLLATRFTNGATGSAGFGTSHDDQGVNLEMYMQVQSLFGSVGSAGPTFGQTWQNRYPTGNDNFVSVPEFNNQVNSLGGGTVTNANNTGRMIGVLHQLDHMANYFRATHGANLPEIQIRYDRSLTGANGTPNQALPTNMLNGQMNLTFDDWADVDVFFHEYGHHVAEYNNLDWRAAGGGAIGLNHSSNRDNISLNNNGRGYGAVTGSRLAWQEGIASTLGMLAIRDGNMMNAIPGLPASDYDVNYQDIFHPETTTTINETANPALLNNAIVYSLESRAHRSFAAASTNVSGQGEGDELSVQRILWDLYDNTPGEAYAHGANDRSNFGASRLYTLMGQTLPTTDNANGTLHSFTERLHAALANDATRQATLGLPAGSTAAEAMAITGDTYEEYGVSSTNLTQGLQPRLRPFLRWTEQNNDNSGNFGAILYDANWNFVEASTLTADINAGVLDTFTWRPTNPLVPGQDYHFVVLNSAALDGAANPGGFDHFYWSGARLISAIPTPGSVVIAMIGLAASAPRRRR